MVKAPNKFYDFPPYRVDATDKFLLCNGERIPLTPKAFETLLVLIERHGHIVEKNELMRLVWPDAVVEENNLNQNISAIRKALGGNALAQQYIETLPRRGYRFIAEVQELATSEAEPPIVRPLPAAPPLAAPALPPTRRPWWRTAIWALVALVPVAALAYFLTAKRIPVLPDGSSDSIKINRLPATSDAWEVALSPDGKLIAYVVGDVSNQSLRLRQLDTAADTELLARDEGRFRGLAFSPDGKSLYYAQQEKNPPAHVLYQKPTQGGEAKRLLVGVDSAVTFAPDGKRLAFVRENSELGESSIVLANANGTGEQVLCTQKAPDYFAVEGPSWSDDGKLIAVARGRATPKFHFQILTINVETGKETSLSEQPWDWAAKVAWLPKMRGLIVVGRREQQQTPNDQLWLLEYPSGQSRQLLPTLDTYRGVSLDQSGHTLITVRSEMRSNIWVLPAKDSKQARAITSDSASQPGGDGLAWTPDGRLIYTSVANGHKDLWLMQADGTQAKPLTTDPKDNAESPTVTADGKAVIFNAGRSGLPRIWRIGLDGKAPLELTHGKLDLHPASSPLDPFVYFTQDLAGKRIVSRISTTGGTPQALTDKLTLYPSVSPDGKWIACLYQEAPTTARRVAILSATGGVPTQILDLPVFPLASLRWHPDGQSLTYLMRQDGAMNLWRQPLTGGAPEKVTDFAAERIFAYAWSREGRTLATARGTIQRDVVMLSNFR